MSARDKNSQGIIVLGKNSYVGRCLVSSLEKNFTGQLVAAGREDCDLLDISSVKKLFSALGENRYTIVLLACVNKWVANSYSSYERNVTMVKNVVDAMSDPGLNVKSIIFASSVDVYGGSPQLPITEQSQVNPDSWYGLGKYVSEWVLASELAQSKCMVTALRLPGVYGPAKGDRSVIGAIVRRLEANEEVSLTGGGCIKRDYVFIDDLCNVISSLAAAPYDGVINVASGESMSLAEVVRKISNTLEKKARVAETPVDVERDFDLVFDTSLLKSLLPELQFSNIEGGVSSYRHQRTEGESR